MQIRARGKRLVVYDVKAVWEHHVLQSTAFAEGIVADTGQPGAEWQGILRVRLQRMTAVKGVVLNFAHMPEQRRVRKVDTELKRLGRDGVNAPAVRLVNALEVCTVLKSAEVHDLDAGWQHDSREAGPHERPVVNPSHAVGNANLRERFASKKEAVGNVVQGLRQGRARELCA